MKIAVFLKALLAASALAVVAFIFAPKTGAVDALVQAVGFAALALISSIGFALAYPHIFGVQKGETVLLMASDPLSSRMVIQFCTAQENGKLKQSIKIRMMDGSDNIAVIESYPGIVTPARVSLRPESIIKLI